MPAQSSDIGGIFDIDATLSTVSGRLALVQAIMRRLSTPRGGLIGVPSYGFDLTQLIGSTVPMSVVEQRVLEQALAEEEVEDAAVSAELDARTGTLQVTIDIVDGDGPFELMLTSSEVTTQVFLNGTLLEEST